MSADDEVDPFYEGMNAHEDGDGEWTNPYHPSLQRDDYLDWKDGWEYARDFPTASGPIHEDPDNTEKG